MSERALPKGYELVRTLGAGGFGEVLLARQTALDRLVAIKRLHGHTLSSAEDLERFRREALVLAGLHHPAVVRVIDFQRDGADATLVMEYVEGAPLSDLIGTLPAPAALKALADAAEALHAAADHQVVHRDVKPDNVFVLKDGHAKLGDFGLARAMADASVFRTTDGQVRCTPAYFAPELGQVLGEPDARSDAYAFAVMAYEVLTGRLPYEGLGGIAMITAHWTQDPPPPDTIVPGFPAAASAALLAGLAKDPASRLLPRELVARLQAVPVGQWPPPPRKAVRAPETVVLRPPPVPLPPPPKARRRWQLPAAGLVAVAAGGAAFLSQGSDPAFEVRDVRLITTPTDGAGHCPSAHLSFRGTVTTNGAAGRLELRWTRPDGVQGETSTLDVPSGQRSVTTELRFDVTGQRPLTGHAVLHLLSPTPQDATSTEVRYRC